MPPITIHNIPVAPREVQLIFDQFNTWLKFRTGESYNFEPTETEYCAILFDSGVPNYRHERRHMLIEFADTGYTTQLFARFDGEGELTSLVIDEDDADGFEVIA